MAAFSWPVDKLTLLNRALAVTGNNLLAVLNDGSDEFNVCSPAYDDAIAVMTEDHGWGPAIVVNPQLAANPTPPKNTAWDTRYPLPADFIHMIWVRINQNTTDPISSTLGQPTLYDFEEGMLVLNAQGGPPPPNPPQTPGIVSIKYISNNMGAETGTPRFVRALQTYVMSAIYRGLHGDAKQADSMFQAAELLAQYARSRYDMQKPKRQFWNSRIALSRRVRRPAPQVGIDNWGGTGIGG